MRQGVRYFQSMKCAPAKSGQLLLATQVTPIRTLTLLKSLIDQPADPLCTLLRSTTKPTLIIVTICFLLSIRTHSLQVMERVALLQKMRFLAEKKSRVFEQRVATCRTCLTNNRSLYPPLLVIMTRVKPALPSKRKVVHSSKDLDKHSLRPLSTSNLKKMESNFQLTRELIELKEIEKLLKPIKIRKKLNLLWHYFSVKQLTQKWSPLRESIAIRANFWSLATSKGPQQHLMD